MNVAEHHRRFHEDVPLWLHLWADPGDTLTADHARDVCGRPGQAAQAPEGDNVHRLMNARFSEWVADGARSRALTLEARLRRLEAQNSALQEQVTSMSKRLDDLEAESAAEMAGYLDRERKLMEWAGTLPEPPDYGTEDPWEIARAAREALGAEEFERLFRED